MCTPLSRSSQFCLLVRSKPVETAVAITCVALAALAALQFAGVIGGPAILKPISFLASPASACLAFYCAYRIFDQSELAKYGLQRKTVVSDGNCLFHSVLAQLNTDETPAELRARLVEYMRTTDFVYDTAVTSIKRFNGSTSVTCSDRESYLEAIAQDGVWCSEIEVEMLAKMLGHPIYTVHHSTGPQPYLPEAPTGDPLFMFNTGTHFTWCQPLRGASAAEIGARLTAAAAA